MKIYKGMKETLNIAFSFWFIDIRDIQFGTSYAMEQHTEEKIAKTWSLMILDYSNDLHLVSYLF